MSKTTKTTKPATPVTSTKDQEAEVKALLAALQGEDKKKAQGLLKAWGPSRALALLRAKVAGAKAREVKAQATQVKAERKASAKASGNRVNLSWAGRVEPGDKVHYSGSAGKKTATVAKDGTVEGTKTAGGWVHALTVAAGASPKSRYGSLRNVEGRITKNEEEKSLW